MASNLHHWPGSAGRAVCRREDRSLLPVRSAADDGGDSDESLSRTRFSAGVDVSYPLIKRTQRADIILEPVVQVSVSNKADIDPRIPNEDLQVIELDESSLFRMDRFSGYDLVEGGSRVTAGGRDGSLVRRT